MPGKKGCSYNGCLVKAPTKIPMHRFPRDSERSKIWVEASKNPKLHNKSLQYLNQYCCLCSNHFQDWCFLNVVNKKRLVHNALPDREKPTLVRSYIVVRNKADNVIDFIEKTKSVVHDVLPNQEKPTVEVVLESKISTFPSSENPAQKPIRNKNLKRYRDCLKISKNTRLNKKLKEIKSTIVSLNINRKHSNFIMRQISLIRKIPMCKRYLCFKKIFAFRLFCRSKTTYKIMQKLMQLPSSKALNKLINSKLTRPGINDEILVAIKTYIDKIPPSENIFALIFDEISLKSNLTYMSSNDEVVGFENYGGKIMGKTQLIASKALVLMLQSLKSKISIPLGYFMSKDSITVKNLLGIIVNLFNRLDEIKVNVKAIICKLKSSNCSFYSEMGVHSHKPFFWRNGKKIFCFFDTSHLMMMTRKDLKKYDIITKYGTVSFSHIEKFYNFDSTQERRIAPKITTRHLNADNVKSREVFLSTELFSSVIAAGMSLCMKAGLLPFSAVATIEFVGKMNDLFDSMVSESLKSPRDKPYQQALRDSSPHFELWKDIIQNMIQWRFLPRQTSNLPPKKQSNPPVKFHIGWIQTLNATKLLFNDLKKSGIKYLMTKKLNQDCLKSFVWRIKEIHGVNSNPTAHQFLHNFRMCATNDWIDTSKNRDYCYFLGEKYFGERNTNESSSTKTIRDYQDLPDFADSSFTDESKIMYLAGYVSKQILYDLSCPICLNIMTDTENSFNNESMHVFFTSYGNESQSCIYPSKSMYNCFEIFIHVSNIILADILYKSNVLKCLKQSFINVAPLNFLFKCALHGEDQMRKIIKNGAIVCLEVHLFELNYHLKSCKDLKDIREGLKRKSISVLKNTNSNMLDLIYNIRS